MVMGDGVTVTTVTVAMAMDDGVMTAMETVPPWLPW